MTGGILKIYGSFTIDQALSMTLKGVEVIFPFDDGEIIIGAGGTLNAGIDDLNGNVPISFNWCGSALSWKGIKATAGSTLLLRGCLINGACTAVDLAPGSTADISKNTFNSNYYCINAEGNISLLGGGISQNIFDATSGVPQFCDGFFTAAIKLKNIGFISIGHQGQSGVPNHILGYYKGIEAKNSNFYLYNTKFSLGTIAIDATGSGSSYSASIFGFGGESSSNSLIDNHSIGIDLQNYNLAILNSRIESTDLQIQAFHSNIPTDIDISSCFFESMQTQGVLLSNSIFSGFNINNNKFRDNNTDLGYRHCVSIQSVQFAFKGKGNISNNEFYDDFKIHPFPPPVPFIPNQHVGVYVAANQGITVESNAFYQNYSTTQEHEYKGLLLNYADKSNIIRNTFIGSNNPAPSTNNFQYQGLADFHSSKCYIFCNSAENLNSGLYFSGSACNPAYVQHNVMSDNQNDLHLNSGTIIGVQDKHQNRWPSSSPNEAFFDGDPGQPMLDMSKFVINSPGQNSNLWAVPRIPSDGWFEISQPPFILQIDCYDKSEEDPNDPSQTRASRMVIDGFFEPYKGYPATTWDASLYAFSELLAQITCQRGFIIFK